MEKISAKVLKYWFGETMPCQKAKYDIWFRKSAEQDREITEQFQQCHSQLTTDPHAFGTSARQLLSAIIVLDQFSRNMFRDSAKSFSQDSQALQLSRELIDKLAVNGDDTVGRWELMFAYMPFMHSESQQVQEESLKLYGEIAERFPDEMQGTLNFAKQHYDIVKRFGRYPHRNAILKRTSTEEELQFLTTPNSSF